MQKKIIALAIAAAVSAPAFADTSNVTVYGVANVSYDMVNVGADNTGVAGWNANKVSSNTSRLGLKGTEDLGGGLSAIWQIESLVNIDNSSSTAATGTAGNTIGSRNTFAGLSSASAGTVLLGRHDTPYNIASRSMDLFTDGIADNRSLMGGVGVGAATAGALALAGAGLPVNVDISAGAGFDGRQPDVVAYISPAMSGFTGAIAYVAGAENAGSAQSKGSAWSLAGLYGNGPLNVNVGYEVHDIGEAAGTVGAGIPAGTLGGTSLKESAWKLAASYTMDAFTINGVYEKTSDNFGTLLNMITGAATVPAGSDVFGHRSYYLAGKYAFGSNAVKVAYTNMGDRNLAANSGATQWSLGYDHGLSKRTTVYALYTKLNNDANSGFGLSGNGTGGGAFTANGTGASVSAVSLGMKHTF